MRSCAEVRRQLKNLLSCWAGFALAPEVSCEGFGPRRPAAGRRRTGVCARRARRGPKPQAAVTPSRSLRRKPRRRTRVPPPRPFQQRFPNSFRRRRKPTRRFRKPGAPRRPSRRPASFGSPRSRRSSRFRCSSALANAAPWTQWCSMASCWRTAPKSSSPRRRRCAARWPRRSPPGCATTSRRLCSSSARRCAVSTISIPTNAAAAIVCAARR